MRKTTLILAVAAVLALAGVSWAALPAPTMVWEMVNPNYAPTGWGRTNYVDDTADTVLVGSRYGLFEIDTSGTIVHQFAADITSAVKMGGYIYAGNSGASPNWWSSLQRMTDDWAGAWEYIDPVLYGFEGAGPNISTDGSYLYMGSYTDASPSIGNKVRKLEITAGAGGDPFGINVVWTSLGIAKKGAQPVRYSSYDGNIYSAQGADDCYIYGWPIARVNKDTVGDDGGEGVATPDGLGIGGTFTLPPYQDVQRYGDYIFLASGASGTPDYGLSSVNVYDFNPAGTPPNVLDNSTHQQFLIETGQHVSTIAVHGDAGTGTPEGFWVTTRRNSDEAYVLRYYTFGSVPPLHNPGDVNGDDFVGGADLTKILDNWGQSPADWADGDIAPFDAGDDFVGGADYTQVLDNWGNSYAPEVVPEPATMLVVALAGLIGFIRRR